MALKQRLMTTLVASVAVFACCSGDSQVATTAPTRGPSPTVAASCTQDAQVSIFRPTDFSSLVNRSVLVVVGHVTDQAAEVENFDTRATTPSAGHGQDDLSSRATRCGRTLPQASPRRQHRLLLLHVNSLPSPRISRVQDNSRSKRSGAIAMLVEALRTSVDESTSRIH